MTRLQKLAALARLLRDRDLAQVQKDATACRDSEMRLAVLARPHPLAQDTALMIARQSHITWAQSQHVRVTCTLAHQKAALCDNRAQAARSFARAQVLQTLAQVRK